MHGRYGYNNIYVPLTAFFSPPTQAHCPPKQLQDNFVDIRSVRPEAGSLQQLLHAASQFETGRGPCVSCKHVGVTEEVAFTHDAYCLAVHLQRFRGGLAKDRAVVTFEEQLQLGPPGNDYRLKAIVVHSGADIPTAGKFFTFIRVRSSWWKCDGQRTQKVDLAAVLQEEAYILFYTRRPEAQEGEAEAGEGVPKKTPKRGRGPTVPRAAGSGTPGGGLDDDSDAEAGSHGGAASSDGGAASSHGRAASSHGGAASSHGEAASSHGGAANSHGAASSSGGIGAASFGVRGAVSGGGVPPPPTARKYNTACVACAANGEQRMVGTGPAARRDHSKKHADAGHTAMFDQAIRDEKEKEEKKRKREGKKGEGDGRKKKK